MIKVLYFIKGIIKLIGFVIGGIIFVIPYIPYLIAVLLIEIGCNNNYVSGGWLDGWQQWWDDKSELWAKW